MKITTKCVASIHFTLTDDSGTTLDSTEDQEPINYLHGTDALIPGLERELEGKVAGDRLKVSVQPADGYGEINPELIKVESNEAFEGIEDLEVGMQLEAKGPKGQTQIITVVSISDDGITISGNHPLAGKTLHYDVSVEAVREATDSEIAHGHIH
ncbi:MAG: peptidylprolyl isomerase [Gammaproteobacteria bacterium]|nr:MAG: peptidylprolyl isomerase [Gammaproteobacteria bacterium]